MKVCTSSTVLILILALSTCKSQDPLKTLTKKLEQFMKQQEFQIVKLKQLNSKARAETLAADWKVLKLEEKLGNVEKKYEIGMEKMDEKVKTLEEKLENIDEQCQGEEKLKQDHVKEMAEANSKLQDVLEKSENNLAGILDMKTKMMNEANKLNVLSEDVHKQKDEAENMETGIMESLTQIQQDLAVLKNVTSEIEGDCHWSPFGPWSECTQPCGGGQQDRTREGHSHGGKDCVWDKAKETRSCNTQSCPPVLILRRGQFGNPQDFFSSKLWAEYEEGFGDENKEYWRGLKQIAALTSTGNWELNVTLVDLQGTRYSAIYDSFKIDASSTYNLRVSGYNKKMSNIKDSLAYSNNMGFSTRDRDNDKYSGGNCAADHYQGAGWWYNECSHSRLTGLNLSDGNSPVNNYNGIQWYNDIHSWDFSWPQAEMTIKRK